MILPLYSVLIEGHLPPESELAGLRGFFASRNVYAENSEEVRDKAVQMVANDWLKNQISHPRQLPSLRIEEIHRTNWWRWLRWSNRGYSFYEEG